jgi:hypothetical protein
MSKLDEIRNRLKNNDGGTTSSSKLDEIRNRLKKDHEILNAPKNQPEVEHRNAITSQSKDAAASPFSDDDIVFPKQNNKRALFIGNDQYHFCNPLRKCVDDARAMQQLFNRIGYTKAVLDVDLNADDMHKTFARLKEDIQPGDELVISFSGHGVQVNSEIYLVPIDFGSYNLPPELKDDKDLSGLEAVINGCINLDREMDEMLASGAKVVVAVIDACRTQTRIDYGHFWQTAVAFGRQEAQAGVSQKLTSKASIIFKEKASLDDQAKAYLSKGKAILFATSHDTSALEASNLPNGIFTHYFLKEAQKKGRTISEVMQRVRELVSEHTDGQQVPTFENNVSGEIYFINQS